MVSILTLWIPQVSNTYYNMELYRIVKTGGFKIISTLKMYIGIFWMVVPCIWFEIRVNYQLDANICLF